MSGVDVATSGLFSVCVLEVFGKGTYRGVEVCY